MTFVNGPEDDVAASNLPSPLTPTTPIRPYVYGALPFLVDWEVWRVDHHSSLVLDDICDWIESLSAAIGDPKQLWNCLRLRAALKRSIHPSEISMPEPSSSRVWELVSTKGWNDGQVHPSCGLEMTGEGRFKITPKPMALGESRRVYRKFGADRFLSVSVPKNFVRERREQVCDFLCHPQIICGREYRAFFVKEAKNRTNFTAHFFATKGAGLVGREISLEVLMQWLLCLNKNRNEKAPKLWSRISLALSSTKPSIVFSPEEIRLVPDIEVNGECMTDGCARASPAVFRAIWESGILTAKETPTAVQGRVGGAKGVWFADPSIHPLSNERWIEIRPSQLKFKYDPQTFHDPQLRTLVYSFVAKLIAGCL